MTDADLMETVTLTGGQIIHNVHPVHACRAVACCIHSPSGHHMQDWPQNWRADRSMMERTCPHGIGHPDPDHMAYVLQHPGPVDEVESGVHGCDGCCIAVSG